MKNLLRLERFGFSVVFIVCLNNNIRANDSVYVRKIIDTLASNYFKGRGYVDSGVQKAGSYIATTFQQLQLQPLNKISQSYLLPFQHSINSFPTAIKLVINGKQLIAGKDFIVGEDSRGLRANGNLSQADSVTFINASDRLVITLKDKLTWSASTTLADYTSFQILKSSVDLPLKNFKVSVENKFIQIFDNSNVAAFVKGTAKPDSFLVFTAHYDHLGMMGDIIFPGANDNASGIGLLLCLAQYYASHPQKYSIVFIAFAGEEAGLLGSKYFTEHPPIDLQRIRFLTNLDLMGNGEEGITVVNATEFPAAFDVLKKINAGQYLFPVVNSRGKAANSDHYFFTEKGVPSFFIYTLGKRKDYHDIYDVANTLPLYKINELMELLRDFYKKMETDNF